MVSVPKCPGGKWLYLRNGSYIKSITLIRLIASGEIEIGRVRPEM